MSRICARFLLYLCFAYQSLIMPKLDRNLCMRLPLDRHLKNKKSELVEGRREQTANIKTRTRTEIRCDKVT